LKIKTEECISCLECIDFCPLNCIIEGDEAVFIDQNECVECGVCLNTEICPVEAIYRPGESMVYPRAIRMQMSDPSAEHPVFKAWGRGTEEAKTNDVTGKFGHGEYGMLFEFGRPVTGTRLAEVQKLTRAVCALGLEILEENPVFGLLEDKQTGLIKKDYLDEKVLSIILEIRFSSDRLSEVVEKILPLLDDVDTVVSVGLVTRFDDEGNLPVIKELQAHKVPVRPNAKINVGLGRPLIR
jgi:NAD-dependent dihydropyrimidine dehydrogenase PreA subunit